jgi:hypothetical protein
MKDSDYTRLSEWINEGTGALMPYNSLAQDLTDTVKKGEIITMLEMTDRDLRFHRCYFSLVNYIYSQMPRRFRAKLPEKYFYKYLKHLKGQFDIIAQFGDVVLVEYDSIAFGRMSEHTFREYIRNQLPWIYSDVIGKYYKVGGWRYNKKINDIEDEYKKFLSKL